MHDVIIIGSGPAGMTAAIYAARANLKPLVFGGAKFGGALMTTTEVENFPGFPEGIKGPELMQKMIKQAQNFGTEIKFDNVTSVDFSNPDQKAVFVGDTKYEAKSVILATGSFPRMLKVPGEQEFWNKGVSTCATCDGAFFRDKVVAVVGGGDSAMEEASFLTRLTQKVYLIHRRDEFRASQIMQDRVLANEKIEILWNTEVKEIVGEDSVTGLKLFNNKDNAESEIAIDGFFVAIGHIPAVKFLENQIDLDDQGFIAAQSHTKTNIPGVFVAGDVHDHHYQQAITAAGMGCMAAMDAEQYLDA